MTDSLRSFKDRLKKKTPPIDETKPDPPVADSAKTKPAVVGDEASKVGTSSELLNKQIGLFFTAGARTRIESALDAAHLAGEYRFHNIHSIIRAGLIAYLDGMALSERLDSGGRKRLAINLTEADHSRYIDTFSAFGKKKSEVAERAVLTFIQNGLRG